MRAQNSTSDTNIQNALEVLSIVPIELQILEIFDLDFKSGRSKIFERVQVFVASLLE